MSVIAWDKDTVVADRQMTSGETAERTIKLFKRRNIILGYVGSGSVGMELIDWYLKGADRETYPVGQDRADLLVFQPNKLPVLFEGSAIPMRLENKGALGTGQTPAQAALVLGHTAKEAVVVACKLNIYCGQGITQFKR